MKYISILAQAGDQDVITSENIDSSSQTVTYTTQEGSQTAPDQTDPPAKQPPNPLMQYLPFLLKANLVQPFGDDLAELGKGFNVSIGIS